LESTLEAVGFCENDKLRERKTERKKHDDKSSFWICVFQIEDVLGDCLDD
jgi:hypothetical protein